MRFYIGSTYTDLGQHRKAALETIREYARRRAEISVNFDIVDPEAFPSHLASNLEYRLNEVKSSDYFILILGWRYGHIPDGSEKSIVELEYEAAFGAKLPRFCFVIDDSYPVPPRLVETGEGAKKLQAFKALVYERNVAARFATPADLARELTLAVSVLDLPLSEAPQRMMEHPILEREYRRLNAEAALLRETVADYRERLSRIVPADPIWRGRDFQQDSTLCFVLMPFTDQFFAIYEDAIVPALNAAGLRGLHAGEIFGNREVMEDVWKSICTSRLVIADVTGRNPNVFYELGMAHTLGKECVVVTQRKQDVPFDISSRRYLEYEESKMASLRTRLEKTIKSIVLRSGA